MGTRFGCVLLLSVAAVVLLSTSVISMAADECWCCCKNDGGGADCESSNSIQLGNTCILGTRNDYWTSTDCYQSAWMYPQKYGSYPNFPSNPSIEAGCSGCCKGKCYDRATHKCDAKSGLICPTAQKFCDLDLDSNHMSDTCMDECPHCPSDLSFCKSCRVVAGGTLDIKNDNGGEACIISTNPDEYGMCILGECKKCPSDPTNPCMKCECTASEDGHKLCGNAPDNGNDCEVDTSPPEEIECPMEYVLPGVCDNYECNTNYPSGPCRDYTCNNDGCFEWFEPPGTECGLWQDFTGNIDGPGTIGACGPAGECGPACPAQPQDYSASLHANIDARMELTLFGKKITDNYFPRDPDVVIDTTVNLNGVEYGSGLSASYCGLPKVVEFRLRTGAAYYDWAGSYNIPLFEVFRKKAINAINEISQKTKLKPPLYQYLITNADVNKKIPGGAGDDSTWVVEEITVKLSINPKGPETVVVGDRVEFYKMTNKVDIAATPFSIISPKPRSYSIEIPYAAIKQVIDIMNEKINYDIESLSGTMPIPKKKVYDSVIGFDHGNAKEETGDGVTKVFRLEHGPVVDTNNDVYGIVDGDDVMVQYYGGYWTWWNFGSGYKGKFFPITVDPGSETAKPTVTFTNPPDNGLVFRIIYTTQNAAENGVDYNIDITVKNVVKDIAGILSFLENLRKCCPAAGDQSAVQPKVSAGPGSVTVTGGKSVYMLREPRFFSLDGTAYKLESGSEPLGNITKTFVFNPDDFLNESDVEVYRYEDSFVESECSATALGSRSAMVGTGEETMNSSDNLVVLGFPAGTFGSDTSVTITKLRLDCTIVTSDADGDGVLDDVDNCFNTANPGQADVNRNGVGDACEEMICYAADQNCDGVISIGELVKSVKSWSSGFLLLDEAVHAIAGWLAGVAG